MKTPAFASAAGSFLIFTLCLAIFAVNISRAADTRTVATSSTLSTAPNETAMAPTVVEATLPIFGQSFFQAAPPAPRLEQAPPPVNYALAPGDILRLQIWSRLGQQNTYSLPVDAEGRIAAPMVGPVAAAGLTLTDLEKQLNGRIKANFPHLSAQVSLEKLRSISVQVAGEAVRPGTYILPGLSTVMNALYEAGGPSERGSMRRIKLVRSGQPDKIIDLYKFLLEGNKDQDYQLANGDTIFIQTAGPRITLQGEVVRPARYEPLFPLILTEALKMAGGINETGYTQRVQVERIAEGSYRALLDVFAKELAPQAKFPLLSGDTISVISVLPERVNQVQIFGPVKRPGTFALRENMRATDLINLSEGFREDSEIYLGRADIIRVGEHGKSEVISFNLADALTGEATKNPQLQPLDKLYLYTPDDVTYRDKTVIVREAVKKPGRYARKENMRLADLIAAAGGTAPEAYLERADLIRHHADGSSELLPVDLSRALVNDLAANPLLEDRDELVVYFAGEVRWQDHTVRIEGAVQRPGTYTRSDNMGINDLIFAAGGLLPEASPQGELGRINAQGRTDLLPVDISDGAAGGNTRLADRDILTIPARADYLRSPEVVYLLGEVQHPGAYVLRSRKERISDLIARAGGLTETANPRGIIFARRADEILPAEQKATTDDMLKLMQWFADRQAQLQLANLTGGGKSLPETVAARSSEQTAAEVAAAPTSETKVPSAASAPLAVSPWQEMQQAALKPEQLQATLQYSRVSVDLDKVLAHQGNTEDIMLRDGDRLRIPARQDTVVVVGAVLHPHVLPYESGRSIEDYVARSGGYTHDAEKGQAVVVSQNGDATPRRDLKRILPGDSIVVPNTALITSFRSKWEKYGDVSRVLSGILSTLFLGASIAK
jgi:polysaccharide biosynthesis/export protein